MEFERNEIEFIEAQRPSLAIDNSVDAKLEQLLSHCQANEAASAIIPWFCDALTSASSRRDYLNDMKLFFNVMLSQGIHPFEVTGDHVRLFKESLVRQGRKPAGIARILSVVRGTYHQFGKKGLVAWNTVSDIQAVQSPRVNKNTTPNLSEKEACSLLRAPDTNSVIGVRDQALLFVYFKTACRCSAIINAKVGDLERTDTDWYLSVKEKRDQVRRMALLEASGPVLHWLRVSGIGLDRVQWPLFTPLMNDRQTPKKRKLSQQLVLQIVKKHASAAGIQVKRLGRRSVCTHSLRKTVINNALEHGAKVEDVQQLAGHAYIQTTQEYIEYSKKGAEDAARRCQIR